jgi:hypothetical protein
MQYPSGPHDSEVSFHCHIEIFGKLDASYPLLALYAIIEGGIEAISHFLHFVSIALVCSSSSPEFFFFGGGFCIWVN